MIVAANFELMLCLSLLCDKEWAALLHATYKHVIFVCIPAAKQELSSRCMQDCMDLTLDDIQIRMCLCLQCRRLKPTEGDLCGLLHWRGHCYTSCCLGRCAVAHCRRALHHFWCSSCGQCSLCRCLQVLSPDKGHTVSILPKICRCVSERTEINSTGAVHCNV